MTEQELPQAHLKKLHAAVPEETADDVARLVKIFADHGHKVDPYEVGFVYTNVSKKEWGSSWMKLDKLTDDELWDLISSYFDFVNTLTVTTNSNPNPG